MKLQINKTCTNILIFLLVGFVFIYLFIVFTKTLARSDERVTLKPGIELPKLSDECRQIIVAASLNPHANIRHSEFREYGNIWLWDGAKTKMYDTSVMKHTECLNYLLQTTIATKRRIILVLYNRETKSDVLVIRNYK